MSDRDELIRRRAYAIWESEGRPHGQDRRHWEQASREMAKRQSPARQANRAAGAAGVSSAAVPGRRDRPADEG